MFYRTEARKAILEFLKSDKEKAFSADEIFSGINSLGTAKSTLFRQLASLSNTKEIKRIRSESKRSVKYQYFDKESCLLHLHLKCRVCGKLIHICKELSESLENEILKAESFFIDKDALLPGTCLVCQRGGDAL